MKQPNAARPHRHEWYLEFPQSIERWDGVLKLDYAIGEGYTAVGRAYKYSADAKILRLRAPTRVKGLRLGGFETTRGNVRAELAKDSGFETGVSMLRAIARAGAVPVARVAWLEPGTIMRVLDGGHLR